MVAFDSRRHHRDGSRLDCGALARDAGRLTANSRYHPIQRSQFCLVILSPTKPLHHAMCPFGPAAQPALGLANLTVLYARVSTIRHVSPPSCEKAVPARPTATMLELP